MQVKTRFALLTIGLALTAPVLSGSLYAASSVEGPAEKTVAARLEKDLVVVLTNGLGKLNSGRNAVCVVVRDPRTGEAADVRNVSIDFSRRTGRIIQSPVTARLARENAGRYCGDADLGPQSYKSANFYVEIRYSDMAGKGRRIGLSLDVEQADHGTQ